MAASEERARQVKRTYEDRWLALEGVVAVGIGQDERGEPSIVVSVEADGERFRRWIPERVDGVRVEIRVTGPMQAL
jgi:hypothetical protein